MSTVWPQIFVHLWAEKVTKEDVARQLNMPIDELESLVFGLTGAPHRPERQADQSTIRQCDDLSSGAARKVRATISNLSQDYGKWRQRFWTKPMRALILARIVPEQYMVTGGHI